MTDGPDRPAEPLLTAAVLRAWVSGAVERLEGRRAELDELNVFPVADSDTGTNLALTLAEARAAVTAEGDVSAARLGVAMARGALVGARGNSGVIVSQYVGALARHGSCPVGAGRSPALSLADGLAAAAQEACAAVAQPVEGTVLTVARAVADGARDAAHQGADAPGTLVTAVQAGYAALERTTEQLPALRRAGVVDAGALGLLLVLDGLLGAVGRPVADRLPAVPGGVSGRAVPLTCDEDPGGEDPGGEGPGGEDGGAACGEGGEFEVMYLVSAVGGGPPAGAPHQPTVVTDTSVASALRDQLSALGGSVAVVGDDGLWQAHVHTDAPLDVLALPAPIGTSATQYRIRHLAAQAGVHGAHRRVLGLVAVTAAPGLVPDLARAGAVVVLVPAGGTPGPELARAVADTGSGHVLVLAAVPCPTLVPGADVLDRLAEVQLVVGAATFASLGPDLGDAAVLGLVWGAVHGVGTAEVLPGAGPDDLGASDGDAAVGAPGQAERVLACALDLLDDGCDVLTVLTGRTCPPGVLEPLAGGLRDARPEVEVLVLAGVLPGDTVQLGVE